MRAIQKTQAARTRVPIPAWAWGLAAVLTCAEVAGWVNRVAAAPPAFDLLSMDAPYSMPRLLVATVFLAAGLAAAAGARRLTGRRTWWAAIAAIAVAIALIKAGSTVHARAVRAIGGYDHPTRNLLVFGGLAVAVIVWLYWLSRSERRDRRRVLLGLGGYAVAAVGLSTVSDVVQSAFGYSSVLTATAVLVEETGEALASVAVLIAVLVGVAPRLVLPAGWALHRPSDTESPTVEALRSTRRRRRAQ